MQDRALVDADGDLMGAEAEPAALVDDDQLVVLVAEAERADPGGHSRMERARALQELVAEPDAVARAEVDQRRRRAGTHLGVMPGHVRLVEHDVVVLGAADPDGAVA